MLIVRSGKLEMTEEIELPNQEKIRTLEEKETYKYSGILGVDTIKKVEMEKRLKRMTRIIKKTTRNQTIQQKPHQRDKHLACPSLKILETILNVDKEER